ncbi:(4Fe-4S)-binding protein [Bacteroides sp. OttesenSCG-928-D19]|nr:(4Fe-4S)-binding protein [Bacteroides sp. OttesenSCG-928-N06]MDL2303799.1 (4Fe-4S)-binding protein [Bacteroides sp. OttesenSCG-928-D19]
MDKVKIHEYPNGEITVLWEPALCIHAGTCIRELPAVYNPRSRPWIKVENATTEELMAQIDKCPSGALKYRREYK